jgi:hypothetical protein
MDAVYFKHKSLRFKNDAFGNGFIFKLKLPQLDLESA